MSDKHWGDDRGDDHNHKGHWGKWGDDDDHKGHWGKWGDDDNDDCGKWGDD